MKKSLVFVLLLLLTACGMQEAPVLELSDEELIAQSTCSYGAVTIDDDLQIPSGVTCTLNGTIVQGNIKLFSRSGLNASNIRVDGSVQGEGARLITVLDSIIKGNIQAKQGVNVNVRRTRIDGSLQIESNRGNIYAIRNIIKADLQSFQNVGATYHQIQGNTIDGNLQCKANNPAPTGGNNRVSGNKEDQCRRL